MRLLVPAAVAALIATTAMTLVALPASGQPASGQPVAGLSGSALPGSALPGSALPGSALPGSALPVVTVPREAPLGSTGAGSRFVPAEPTTGSGPAPVDPGHLTGTRASAVTASEPSGRSFTWPLAQRPTVHRRFEPPRDRYSPGHRGVDLLAKAGQPVLSAGEGVVAFSGVIAGRGVITVRHSGVLRTSYEPVERRAPSGMRVHRGTQIGVISPSSGHCIPLTCLHWGAISGATYLDPLSLLGLGRPILLPLG